MQCKELEAVLESEGLSPLPPEAREHLAGCPNCQDLLADLSAVVVAAKRIPAEVAPPERIWVSIRAQLEAEGIIQDTQPVVVSPAPWWSGIADMFRPRVLATVSTVLFVIAGTAYFVEHHGSASPVQLPPPVQKQAASQEPSAVVTSPVQQGSSVPAKPLSQEPSPVVVAHSHPRISSDGLRPSPSEEAYLGDSAAVLNQTEGLLPSRELANNPAVDASLRQNLRTLNDFIAECESRLKQNPRDQLIREYLNMAYQQKAELLNAMMDSGRSEH
ncbi:MAG: hypothetical protein WBR26_00445 [Candidatus Acidiferrum sp.]